MDVDNLFFSAPFQFFSLEVHHYLWICTHPYEIWGQPRFVNLFSKCHLPHAGVISGIGNTVNQTDKSPHPYQVWGREKISKIHDKKYILDDRVIILKITDIACLLAVYVLINHQNISVANNSKYFILPCIIWKLWADKEKKIFVYKVVFSFLYLQEN